MCKKDAMNKKDFKSSRGTMSLVEEKEQLLRLISNFDPRFGITQKTVEEEWKRVS